MNNKGFTVIELLAVILILLAISMVSVSSVSSSLKRNDQKESERQREIVINASKIYFSTHDVDCVSISDLIDYKYVDSDNVNKYSGDNINVVVKLEEQGITIENGSCNN